MKLEDSDCPVVSISLGATREFGAQACFARVEGELPCLSA